MSVVVMVRTGGVFVEVALAVARAVLVEEVGDGWWWFLFALLSSSALPAPVSTPKRPAAVAGDCPDEDEVGEAARWPFRPVRRKREEKDLESIGIGRLTSRGGQRWKRRPLAERATATWWWRLVVVVSGVVGGVGGWCSQEMYVR